MPSDQSSTNLSRTCSKKCLKAVCFGGTCANPLKDSCGTNSLGRSPKVNMTTIEQLVSQIGKLNHDLVPKLGLHVVSRLLMPRISPQYQTPTLFTGI